jgi:pimeloyl-ACP methyl ester carboxylesterase
MCFRAVMILCVCFGCGMLTGCGTRASAENGVVIFVPGVSGDGPWYGAMKRGLRDGGVELPIQTFSWGAPPPLFVMNFNNKGIHDSAERNLARRIGDIRQRYPQAPIVILTHSAGGGVALGALARLPEKPFVERMVLLHPTVSPGYDLSPALARIRGTLGVFHSDRDTTFLQWRTSNFGTYDGVRTTAAGNRGFVSSTAPPEAWARVRQVGWEESFRALGHDGGHFGVIAGDFAREKIAPLLRP